MLPRNILVRFVAPTMRNLADTRRKLRTVEGIDELSHSAAVRLVELGILNVFVHHADGTLG